MRILTSFGGKGAVETPVPRRRSGRSRSRITAAHHKLRRPGVDLRFPPLRPPDEFRAHRAGVVAVVASVIIVEQISSDGESNGVEGLRLLSVYAVLAVLFFFLPDMHPAAAH